MATTVTYKGQTLATVENQTKTLQTAGTWCEDDFTLTDVSGGGGGITVDGMASRTEPAGEITITSTIKEYAFSECVNITKVTINGETVLRGYSFKGCTRLVTVDAPTITGFSSAQQFIGDTALVNVNLPNTTTLGNNVFQNCTSLEILDFPKLTRLNYTRCLYGCSNLKTLILRYSGGVVPVGNDVFTNTPFASGGTGGTVYVPQALISSYQTASNWSTLYSAGTCNFVAIEGSEYE